MSPNASTVAAPAKKAAALKAASGRAPPGINEHHQKKSAATKAKAFAAKVAALQAASEPLGYRLMSKPEICALVGASYPAIWQWMRDGKFPRPRVLFGRSMWVSTEIEQWLAKLPVRRLKPPDQANNKARGRKGPANVSTG